MVTKTKKLQEKLRLYYRGPQINPTRTLNAEEFPFIVDSLKEYLQDRQQIYRITWHDQSILVKPVFGLNKTLRCLRRKQVRALIYDEAANEHLKGYLRQTTEIPVVETKLIEVIAKKVGLSNLLVLSIVEIDSSEVDQDKVTTSKLFDNFSQIFYRDISKSDPTKYKLPSIERVKSSAQSKVLKKAKKAARRERKLKNALARVIASKQAATE